MNPFVVICSEKVLRVQVYWCPSLARNTILGLLKNRYEFYEYELSMVRVDTEHVNLSTGDNSVPAVKFD